MSSSRYLFRRSADTVAGEGADGTDHAPSGDSRKASWPKLGIGHARRVCAYGLALSLAAAPLAGCGQTQGSSADAATTSVAATQTSVEVSDGYLSLIDTSELFSDRDLDPSYDASSAISVTLSDSGSTASGSGVSVDGSTITISAEGTYVLSGTLTDGRIVIDAADDAKIQLVLNGVQLSSSTGTALYVRNADKVFLTLADGSSNSISATGESASEDDHTLDGAVWSHDDLTVNGTGALSVTSAAGHGIVVKDDLTLVSGTLTVGAAGHAIQAKDSVAVRDGFYTLDAGTDGIHCENSEDAMAGFIYVGGGTFNVTAASDGFDASYVLQVDAGSISVSAGDDGLHAEYDLALNGGEVNVTGSYEALEGSTVSITGGTHSVVASDDGINAAGDPSEDTQVEVSGEDASASDGTADATADAMGGAAPSGDQGQTPPDGSNGEMPTAPEGGFSQGTPGEMPTDNSGDADGGAHWGEMAEGGGAMAGGGMDENDETASVLISGGSITIDASGDGIDSNGDLTITGGEVYVSGPTSGGDGALDYAGTGSITGGVLVASGSAGMAQNLGSESTQGCMLVSLSGDADDTITLSDASGNALASYAPTKSYACVVVSAPGVTSDGSYTVSNSASSVEVTMSGTTYSDVTGSGGGMAGPGGMGMGDMVQGGTAPSA